MSFIYEFYFFHSFTTAPPVTTTTTASPTQNPTDQFIALQSLASKAVEVAQTGRMASSLKLDMVSIEVTDPEPPRNLPKGWTRATPEEGKDRNIYNRSSRKRAPRKTEKSGRNQSWSLTRMSSRKRPHGKTIEDGRLQELQKLKRKKQKNLKCLMSVFISDIDTAELYVQFLDQNTY